MVYEIFFSKTAEKQLKKLDRKIQERIVEVLERVRIKPERYVIKLIGDKGYKLRVGDYRVILDIDATRHKIFVLKIGHRKNIYK
jgi:mRNA interferase RelE/StbE